MSKRHALLFMYVCTRIESVSNSIFFPRLAYGKSTWHVQDKEQFNDKVQQDDGAS